MKRPTTASSVKALSIASAAFRVGEPEEYVGVAGVNRALRQTQEAQALRGRKKRQMRLTVNELVQGSNNTIVLNHVQPRWLREKALARLEAFGTLTETDLTELKERGPDAEQ